MKQIFPVLVALVVGLSAMFVLLNKPDSPTDRDSGEGTLKDEQIAKLNKELREAKAKSGRVELIETKVEVPGETIDNRIPPQTIIDQLVSLDPQDERTDRRSVYLFESLIEHGIDALPPIRKFLGSNQDFAFRDRITNRKTIIKGDGKTKTKTTDPKPEKTKDLKPKDRAKEAKAGKPGIKKPNRTGSVWAYFRPYPKLEKKFPPTLRIGLFDVAAQIGSQPAIDILLESLKTTGRGVEVAYLEEYLQRAAQDKYVKEILRAARELLASMPEDSDENALEIDRYAKDFLYSILVKYKDREFIDTAKDLLVRSDGSVDGHALAYLRRVLGAESVPIIQNAINEGRITDDVASYALRDAVLHYIGQNAAADQLLLQTVQEGLNKQEEGGRFNWGAMKLPTQALFRNLENTSDEALVARQRLLSQMRQQSSHPEFVGGLNRMENKFNSVLEDRRSPRE
jgi:hypothetical protein